MTVAIIDYDVGNLKNVHTALRDVTLDAVITRDPAVIDSAEAIVLPGVGAFADAMANLERFALDEPLKRSVAGGKPLLGICLGMQLLFDESEEDGRWPGLGLIPGRVVRFDAPGLKVPHMGWNNLNVHREDPIARGITREDYVYFVHSYYAVPKDFDADVVAYADYGVRVPAIVRRGNVIGMQFHPEKSAGVGTRLLTNFKEVLS
jgi:glutamine amidotransferase